MEGEKTGHTTGVAYLAKAAQASHLYSDAYTYHPLHPVSTEQLGSS